MVYLRYGDRMKHLLWMIVLLVAVSGCVADPMSEHDYNYTTENTVDESTNDNVQDNTTVITENIDNTAATESETPAKKVISLDDAKKQTPGNMGFSGGSGGGGSGGGSSHKHHSSDSKPAATPTEASTEKPIDTPIDEPTKVHTETPIQTPTEVPTETEIEVPTETETETPIQLPYQTNPKTMNYDYCLRSSNNQITYIVYGGLNEYLDDLPDSISYYNTPPTAIDFVLRDLNEPNQKPSLDPLITDIQNITIDQDDQARIAISLVQHIPYDYDNFYNNSLTNKYPYEVLYTDIGVCGTKSNLLAYLLRGLGYEVVLFDFDNHRAVGIKCPMEYSYKNSGYAFVESTSPSIITDADSEYYTGNGSATAPLSDDFTILKVCNGISFDSVSEEYNDNTAYDKAYENMRSYPDRPLNEAEYAAWQAEHNKWQVLVDKYDIQVKESK